jgi:hypothetical protein
MPDLQITADQMKNLASKLDELGAVLSDNERAVLVAVFGMAASAVANATKGAQTESGENVAARFASPSSFTLRKGSGAGQKLSVAFLGSFNPSGASSFTVSGIDPVSDDVHVDVGAATVSGGWSKATSVQDQGMLNPAAGLRGSNIASRGGF